MSDPRNRQYTNGEITVFWIPSKCIHATTCFRELIEVFNPGRRPWVNMAGASSRRIIEVVNKCPTQAITWKYNKDLTETEQVAQRRVTREEVTPDNLGDKGSGRIKPANVRIMKDGPIVIEGEFTMLDAEDRELRSTRMTSVCRCGHSRSMPYCDGTHRKTGFSEE